MADSGNNMCKGLKPGAGLGQVWCGWRKEVWREVTLREKQRPDMKGLSSCSIAWKLWGGLKGFEKRSRGVPYVFLINYHLRENQGEEVIPEVCGGGGKEEAALVTGLSSHLGRRTWTPLIWLPSRRNVVFWLVQLLLLGRLQIRGPKNWTHGVSQSLVTYHVSSAPVGSVASTQFPAQTLHFPAPCLCSGSCRKIVSKKVMQRG